MVLGIFSRGHDKPQEEVVFICEPKHLFRHLWRAAFRLRGPMKTFFFSLGHVKQFRLYKCNVETGTHERIDLDSNGVADLQLLLEAYKQWRPVPDHIAEAWADWIHRVLNDSSYDVYRGGTYSLELVLDWSAKRITAVVLFPIRLSLAVGIWINSGNWTDLATIQTAWGTASYVVTAGGCEFSSGSQHGDGS